jgi:hypothetical protein
MCLWKLNKAESFYKNLYPNRNTRLNAERPENFFGLKSDVWLFPSKTERIS